MSALRIQAHTRALPTSAHLTNLGPVRGSRQVPLMTGTPPTNFLELHLKSTGAFSGHEAVHV